MPSTQLLISCLDSGDKKHPELVISPGIFQRTNRSLQVRDTKGGLEGHERSNCPKPTYLLAQMSLLPQKRKTHALERLNWDSMDARTPTELMVRIKKLNAVPNMEPRGLSSDRKVGLLFPGEASVLFGCDSTAYAVSWSHYWRTPFILNNVPIWMVNYIQIYLNL
jgi:hypothetical protein